MPATHDLAGRRSRTLWRVGGGLALAHVVLLFAGFSQEVPVEHGDGPAVIQKVYGGANLTRVFAGGYVEAMSFVVLTAAIVIIARLFGRRTETGRIAAQTFLALGVAFVASTLAVGFAPGAAALYGAHNGADPATIAIVNDIRNFGYVLQVALQMAMALALGIAALAEKRCPKWVGWVGAVLGARGHRAGALRAQRLRHGLDDLVGRPRRRSCSARRGPARHPSASPDGSPGVRRR